MVFFTSNLGYSDAQQGTRPIGYGDEEGRRRAADGVVRRGLRGGLTPEFLNRVRTIHFERLGPGSAERILDLELERIARRYRELHGLRIEVASCARAELIRRGFSPEYGARHLASTLEAVCNVDIARKIRTDDRSDEAQRGALIAWLRDMRGGERPFSADEVRERMAERARARLAYDTLRVEFREGEFRYAAERGR
jgi:ATP-dependent Clp protease ATP-binding subunit ClpA